MFSEVKNVNVESLKNGSKLLDFSVDSFLFFLSINAHEWVHQSGFHFWGARIVFVGETRIDFV